MEAWVLYKKAKDQDRELLNIFTCRPNIYDLEYYLRARLFPNELERAFILPGINRKGVSYWLQPVRMEFRNHLINVVTEE